MISSKEDGITHICISPKAATELGRKLYIGAAMNINHPELGNFKSIIAYWLWLSNNKLDLLREIHHESLIASSWVGLSTDIVYRTHVKDFMQYVFINDTGIFNMLRFSTLPFVSYEIVKFKTQDHIEEHIYPLSSREWYDMAVEDIRKLIRGMG